MRADARSLLPCILGAAALLQAGCSASPPVQRPAMDLPAAFKEAQVFRPAQSVPPDPGRWWQLFGDDTLNALQDEMERGNLNLRVALAQHRAARAALDAARASFLPGLGVAASATRSDSPARHGPANDVTLAAAASWELDLWGRIAAQNEAAAARAEASGADAAAVRLSLQATLVQVYLALRAAEAQEVLLQDAVAAYRRSVELTQDRFRAGVVSGIDLAQARTQLKSAQAQQVEQRRSRAQLEHALAVLLGKPPALLALKATGRLPAVPKVPEVLPASLLERRPDIAAAERRVAAAGAQLGATRTAFFPAVTLSAEAGFRKNTVAQLIAAPNLFWSLGPAVALAAFDGGARRAAIDNAQAGLDQATAVYRQTVLAGLQEVEDNLVAAATLEEESGLLEESLAEARRALELATHQYRVGTVSYLSVVSAQATALGLERGLVEVRSRRLLALGQLAKNAGGGWADH